MNRESDAQGDLVFRAISDPSRRKILSMLEHGPLPVATICGSFDVSQSAVSQQLRVLRDSGLVRVTTEWRQRIYHLQPEPLREVLTWVRHFEKLWDNALDRLGGVVEDPRTER